VTHIDLDAMSDTALRTHLAKVVGLVAHRQGDAIAIRVLFNLVKALRKRG
jgi:hypothetical protein